MLNPRVKERIENLVAKSQIGINEIQSHASKVHDALTSIQSMTMDAVASPGEYHCEHFGLYELVDEKTYNRYIGTQEWKLWLLFDNRALWTLDALRDKYGPGYVNTWYGHLVDVFNNIRQWSGWRPPECDVGADLSQHRFGRGFDPIYIQTSASQIRQDAKEHPEWDCFRYITRIEEAHKGTPINWLHFDVGNDKENGKIKFLHV
jgi:hypothetical protein